MGSGASSSLLANEDGKGALHPHIDPKALALAALAAARLSQAITDSTEQMKAAMRACDEAATDGDVCKALIGLARVAARQPDEGAPLVELGGLAPIVARLARDESTKVRLTASHVLTRMARRGAAMQEGFVRAGATPLLMQMARSGEPDLSLKAASAVRTLALAAANLPTLCAPPVVDALVALLPRFTPECQSTTADALGRMGATPETRRALLAAKAMPPAAALLDHEDPDVQSSAATLVTQMCLDEPPAQKAALKVEVPRRLAGVLESINRAALHSAAECVAALGALPRARQQLADAGVVELLTGVLRVQTSEAIRYQATSALLQLSQRRENLGLMSACGAAEVLVFLLEAPTPAVRQHSAATLRNMCGQRDLQDEVARVGGVAGLTALVSGCGDAEELLEVRGVAIEALFQLVQDHPANLHLAVDAEAQRPLLSILGGSPADHERFCAAATVMHLSTQPALGPALIEFGALQALATAVGDAVDTVRQPTLEAMALLVTADKEARQQLSGSLDDLVRVLRDDLPACQSGAAAVIMHLSEEEGLGVALVEAGVMPPLAALLVRESGYSSPAFAGVEAEPEPEPAAAAGPKEQAEEKAEEKAEEQAEEQAEEKHDDDDDDDEDDEDDDDWGEGGGGGTITVDVSLSSNALRAGQEANVAREAAAKAAAERPEVDSGEEEEDEHEPEPEPEEQEEEQEETEEQQQEQQEQQQQRQEGDVVALWRATIAVSNLASTDALQLATGEMGVVEALVILLQLESLPLRRAVATTLSVLTKVSDNRWRVYNAGGVELLAAQLADADPTLQLYSAWTLGRVASEAEELRYAIANSGALELLAQLLTSEDDGVARHSAGALTRVAADENLVAATMAAGAGQSVVGLLQQQRGAFVYHAGVSLASALSLEPHSTDEFRSVMREAGAVRPLVALLQAPEDDVQLLAALCVRSLGLERGCRVEAVGGGACPRLVAMLERERGAAYQQAGSDAISVLSKSPENQAALREAGAVDPLVDLLQSTERSVQRAAAGALLGMGTDDVNRAEVANAGGLHPLIKLLESRAKALRSAACAALAELARNPDIQVAIVELGGLPPLIACAKAPFPEVQQHAARALGHLALAEENRDKLSDEGATDKLVHMLSDASPKVASEAGFALATMATRQRLQVEIAMAGALPKLIELLAHEETVVQSAAATALKNLAVEQANKQRIAERDGIPPLVALLEHEDKSLVLVALSALVYLGEWEDNRLVMAKSGVLDPAGVLAHDPSNPKTERVAKDLLKQLGVPLNAVRPAQQAFTPKEGEGRCVIS